MYIQYLDTMFRCYYSSSAELRMSVKCQWIKVLKLLQEQWELHCAKGHKRHSPSAQQRIRRSSICIQYLDTMFRCYYSSSAEHTMSVECQWIKVLKLLQEQWGLHNPKGQQRHSQSAQQRTRWRSIYIQSLDTVFRCYYSSSAELRMNMKCQWIKVLKLLQEQWALHNAKGHQRHSQSAQQRTRRRSIYIQSLDTVFRCY